KISIVRMLVDSSSPFTNATGDSVNITLPVWSDANGWPTRISNYQGRLVLGNSPKMPMGIWLSKTNDISNFNGILLNPDDAIGYLLQTENKCEITKLTNYRTLSAFTGNSVYSSAPQSTGAATPSNFFMGLLDNIPTIV